MARRFSMIFAAMLTAAALATPARAAEFATWLAEFRAEAAAAGISAATLDSALNGIEPIPRVVELDRKQPEFTLTFADYLKRVVTAERIEKARKKFVENRELLQSVGKTFGVQPRFIVALWGIETDFGRLTGGFSVVQALATLAHDGRRSTYFRRELLNALKIIDAGHVAADAMKGSWAGAMGQCQFMPSSFLNFAVDQNGDGRKDIWTTPADVFASAANYLAKSGWRDDLTWGRPVRLPKGFDTALADLKIRKPLGEWQALGVRRIDGDDLPGRDLPASIVLPDGAGGPAFAVYANYEAILKWNRSTYFASAVGSLADAMKDL